MQGILYDQYVYYVEQYSKWCHIQEKQSKLKTCRKNNKSVKGVTPDLTTAGAQVGFDSL